MYSQIWAAIADGEDQFQLHSGRYREERLEGSALGFLLQPRKTFFANSFRLISFEFEYRSFGSEICDGERSLFWRQVACSCADAWSTENDQVNPFGHLVVENLWRSSCWLQRGRFQVISENQLDQTTNNREFLGRKRLWKKWSRPRAYEFSFGSGRNGEKFPIVVQSVSYVIDRRRIEARRKCRSDGVVRLLRFAWHARKTGQNYRATEIQQPVTTRQSRGRMVLLEFAIVKLHKNTESQVASAVFVDNVITGTGRNGHNGKRWLITPLGGEDRAVGHKNVLCIVHLAKSVNHAFLGISAHAGGAALVDVLAEDAQLFAWRLRAIQLHRVDNFQHILAHSFGHCVFVFSVAGDDT